MQNTHRHLAAILFTDIVGYTSLMQADESKAVTAAKRYLSILHENVAALEGSILNDYGDGSLCEFASATDALNCAIRLQQALRQEPVVPLRAGLHIGELFFEDGKVFGDGINVASRIQALGQANSILFSAEFQDKIRNRPEFQSVSLGQIAFKNVDRPVEIFALKEYGLVVPKLDQKETRSQGARQSLFLKIFLSSLIVLVVGGGIWLMKERVFGQSTSTQSNSIAILYFENMSGDPAQEYLSDGLTEEITSRLSRMSGLRVKSRSSVLQFKDGTKSAKEIADELGVERILEGSMRRQGNRILVSVHLIHGESQDYIWSENYDREVDDIFEVQSDIAQQVASKFEISLTGKAREALINPPTQNVEAYDFFLKAKSELSLRRGLGGDGQDVRRSITLLSQAISLDPAFADAYALLSENYTYIGTSSDAPDRWLDSARMLAEKAIASGPSREAGFIALAYEKQWEGKYDEALTALQRAHEIKPFSAVFGIMEIYLIQNRYDKAMEWIRLASDYDPAETSYYAFEGWIYYNLDMRDSLSVLVSRAKRVGAESPELSILLFSYYTMTANASEYKSLCRRVFSKDEKEFALNMGIYHTFQREYAIADSFLAISSKPRDLDRGLVKLRLGRHQEGKEILDTAISNRMRFLRFHNMWHLSDISRAYAALEDPQYIDYYNQAVAKGFHAFTYFKIDPFYDLVRDTPEFREIMRIATQRNEKYKSDVMKVLRN